jgi:anti-sigma-K factor RskA
MTCAEFQALVELYAIGALEPAERAACEAHLAERDHQGCLAALARAEEAASLLAEALPPIKPADAVWRKIESALGQSAAAPIKKPSILPLLATLALAAALLVAMLVYRNRALMLEAQLPKEMLERDVCKRELEALKVEARTRAEALALLERPATKLIALAPQGGATSHAKVIMNSDEKRAYLLGGAMDAPSGKDFELWVIRGDTKIPAGILRPGPGGQVLASVDPKLLEAGTPDALAITVEPQGGLPAPSGPVVLVATMPKT